MLLLLNIHYTYKFLYEMVSIVYNKAITMIYCFLNNIKNHNKTQIIIYNKIINYNN